MELADHGRGRSIFGAIKGRLLLLLLVAIIPIAVIQFFHYRNHLKSIRSMEMQSNLEVARLASEYFDHFIQDVLHQELAVGLAFTSSDSLSPNAAEPFLNGIKFTYEGVQNLSWVSPNGRILASSDGTLVGIDVSDRTYFQEIVKGREWAVSSLLHGKGSGNPLFTISLGMRERSGELRGIVITAVHPDNRANLLAVKRFSGGNITIIDRNGQAVFRHPETDWTGKDRDLSKLYPEVGEALSGKEITGTSFRSLGGGRRIYAMTPVRSIGWVARASRPEKETMAPLESAVYRDAGLYLLVVVSSFFISLLFSRGISVPIDKLRNHALSLMKGKWLERVQIRGALELRELGQTFNLMAEEIHRREEQLAYMAEEAGKRAVEMEAVFSSMTNAVIVRDADGNLIKANPAVTETYGLDLTRLSLGDLAEKLCIRYSDGRPLGQEELPSCRALRGQIVKGERHLLTGPEGLERVVLASASPLLVNGELAGSVLVWTDITEQERILKALELERSRLKAIFDRAPEGIVVTDGRGRILMANPVAEQLYGRPIPYGKDFQSRSEFHFRNSEGNAYNPRDFPLTRAALDGETQANVEFSVLWPDGQRRDLLGSTAPIRNTSGIIEGAIAVFQDITSIKKGERERRHLLSQVQAYTEELEWINDKLNEQTAKLVEQSKDVQKARDELEQVVQSRTADLKEANTALRALSSRIITAQEEERKGIARDLHDTILQKLAYTKMSLSLCLKRMEEAGPPPDVAFLNEIMTLITTSIEETRAIMEDLRPSLLDHFGIITALKGHCREFKELYPRIELEEKLNADEEEIPGSLKIPLFRILQEALNNAAKHSQADRIELVLKKTGDVLNLKVSDNGVGFTVGRGNPKRRPGGFGLTSMKERAELSGGSFSISSRKGEGTILSASWVLA